MSKKALFVSLFFLVIASSELTRECSAQSQSISENLEQVYILYHHVMYMCREEQDNPIWPQMKQVMTNIAVGNNTAAQAAIDELLNDFSENQYLPVALHEIAKLYSQFKKYQKANELQQYVAHTWPTHEYAMWSLRDIANQNIELGNMQVAQSAVDKLLANFSENESIILIIYEVAGYYSKFGEAQKAGQLHQYILDNWSEQEQIAIWSLRDVAKLSIELDNEATAQAAIDKLITDFSGDEWVIQVAYDIAEHYKRFGKDGRASQLYQYVINNWSERNYTTIWSLRDVGRKLVKLGQNEAADTAIERIFTEFSGHQELSTAVLQVAEPYYVEALRKEAEGLNIQAKNNFQKSLEIYETVKNRVPGYVATAETCCWTGASYHALGEYAKSIERYQKVVDDYPDYTYVWKAQFMVGRNLESLKETEAISKSEADLAIKVVYEQLIEKYPDCPVADIASRWLSQHNSK